jgi:dihydrofolate reductase
MRFTISTTISIFRIGIPKIHWTSVDPSAIGVRFFQEGNPVMYAVASVLQSSIYGDYYVNNLSLVNRKVLPPGTYRVSYGYYYHMHRYAIANAPMTFSPSIFNVEACSAPIDVAEYPTNVSVGLQMTFGGMFWFDDLGNIGTVLAPLIQTDKLVINSKTSDDILLGNGTYASLTRISNLETKTVNITDGATYLPAGTIVNSSIPYIDSSGALSSAGTNLYVQGGVNTIQSALDSIQSGLGYSIQTSASSFSESLTLSKQNIILSGVSCPMYVPTSQITGNITIGSATGTSTLYKIQNLKIVGNLSWISSSLNELRTYFSNCEFTGNITFPAVSGGGTTWIYFFNCSMNYASSIITIPNQSTYNIVFIRCNFNNQTITNNLVVGNTAYLTFRDCIGLPNLTLGNSVKYGMNATVAGGNSLSAVGLSLGGASTSFLMGNGSLNTTNYNYRKFSMISSVTLDTLRTNANMIGTLNPSTGNVSSANEAKIGDVYNLKVYGTVWNPSTMSFTFGFLGSTHTITSGILSIAVTATYSIDVMYTIKSGTSFGVNACVNVYSTTSTAQFGSSVILNVSGNVANSSTFTCTYTNTNAGTFSVEQMSLNKM